MKKIFLICLLPCLAFAQPSKEVKESLKPWEPLSITENNGNLTIVTNEHRVTDTIFKAIINNGVCITIWLDNPKALDGIKEVTVLNKFKKQGYVFEGGKDTCNELGTKKQNQGDIYLMGHSKIY